MRRTAQASLIAFLVVVVLTSAAGAHPRTLSPRSQFFRTAHGQLVAVPSSRGARLQPTAAARGGHFISLWGDTQLQRDGHDYWMSVQVIRDHWLGHAETIFFLSIARGTGSAHHDRTRFAIQEHSYEADGPANVFTWRPNLTTAHIDTNQMLGRWGLVRLRFVPSSDLHTSCDGATLARPGKLMGTFSFTPQHDNGVFGTIQKVRFGTAKLRNSACHRGFGGGSGGTLLCPSQPTMVGAATQPDAHTFESFFVSSTTQDGVLADALQQQFYGSMSVMHEIFTWGYPSVQVHDDGTNVRVHAKAPVGLSGDAYARPTGDPYVSRPHRCGDGQQVTFSYTDALATPGGQPLTANFDTGSVTLPSTGWEGEIDRQVVTAAP